MGRRTARRLSAAVVAVLLTATGLEGGAAPPPARAETPAWEGTSQPLPRRLRQRMNGVSWRPGCPVPLRDLRLLTMRYHRFDGQVRQGRMVVRDKQAGKVLRVFRRLYETRFPIRRMRLIDAYDGSDADSMRANNTSAFNCRKVGGTSRWSEHAYGRAVDINPVQNPYVRGSTYEPAAGGRYLDRSDVRPGMIVRPSPVIRAFRAVDWHWGGDWTSAKDYQHFSRTGR